ncbi:Bacteriophage lambda tail assembly protein I [Vibrio aerogenes CECT 7868]|uniref:Bacteriophage lambda tail assembly protein I n=1 Tax=Vibrio aerogenes CECT 7868 TaxID=1216006 RepID=A0A1M6C1U5_9VIBR|nr:tail assembly protein [Vibrio aerogenes]SHI54678.1 Bacteriophage lambda tail assembly protein I [Vibrio aerogenes CECT 7868]
MVEIHLHGELARLECPEAIDVQSPYEAIQFLCEVVPGFRQCYFSGQYTIENDQGSFVTEENLHLQGCQSLHFYPAAAGAVTGALVGAGVLIGGMLAVKCMDLKLSGYEERESVDSRNSYLFNGAKNTVEQGVARPLLYGKMEVGGHIISTGLTTEQII